MNKQIFSSPIDLKKVTVTDPFWQREMELVRKEVIPYQWDALNDRVPGADPSWCMRNFRIAGRMMADQRRLGVQYVPPKYTNRGFQALPEDPAHWHRIHKILSYKGMDIRHASANWRG